jgi:hypothetical protein
MKTQTFNGRSYSICTEPLDGLCDVPTGGGLELHVFADLKKKDGLITAVHEALHAENPNWPEDYVDRMGREIGTFLWRLGYRMKRSK